MEVDGADKVPVYVEAEVQPQSRVSMAEVCKRVEGYVNGMLAVYADGPLDFSGDAFLSQHIVALRVTDVAISKRLVYDSEVKRYLLEYATSAMFFADRVVLLHGPPGTGKTSLCQALAQKLSIRLSDRYRYGQLVEVNAHSLFSKWFSESGKLVNKLFASIQDMVDDPQVFVVVLIDEVESLTAARKSALAGNEPSDAIRVVNALLTQIDQLKHHKNVMVMTTSNITEAIDLAFVDRADIKQYIGLPSALARYQILLSCVRELIRVGIITPQVTLLDAHELAPILFQPGTSVDMNDPSQRLVHSAIQCDGLSGRGLRKLPFLAHAMFVQGRSVDFSCYCDNLDLASQAEKAARQTHGLAPAGGSVSGA